MGTLIDPHRPSPQTEADFNREPLYLRNPDTGVIYKIFHKDSIKRCLAAGYTPSSEEAMRAQSIELAELQGRPLPAWAKAADDKPAETPAPTKAK